MRPQEIDWRQAWPDDGLFTAFVQEEIFEDAAELAATFRAPLEEAQAFLDALTEMDAEELVAALQPFAHWYLAEHGEISVGHRIAPAQIVEARDYMTGERIDLASWRQPWRQALERHLSRRCRRVAGYPLLEPSATTLARSASASTQVLLSPS